MLLVQTRKGIGLVVQLFGSRFVSVENQPITEGCGLIFRQREVEGRLFGVEDAANLRKKAIAAERAS